MKIRGVINLPEDVSLATLAGEDAHDENARGSDDPAPEDDTRKANIKTLPDPCVPTQSEIDNHNASHIPFMSWCSVCIKACGKEDGHFIKEKSEDGKPVVGMDYKAFGQEFQEDDKVTSIVVKDENSKTVFAHICLQKGASDKWVVQRILEDLDHLGHVEMVLKTDGEPALVQLAREIKRLRIQPTLVRHPPAYDPQANGAAERAVQEYMGQLRKLKIGLEQRIGKKIESTWAILEWLSELALVLLSRYQVGKDGKTSHRRLMGKECQQAAVEVG